MNFFINTHPARFALTLILCLSCTKKETAMDNTSSTEQSLTEQLAEKAENSKAKVPTETKAIMLKAIEDLKTSEVMSTALKEGSKIPHFTLPDVKKGTVRSSNLLEQGPLLIVFYRGGWCPYCNLQLRDLQKHYREIQETGALLVAISPEAPDQTAETVKDGELDYYVLSDADGKVGQSFGLMYKLPNDLIEVYKGFGIDLEKSNANKNWELPLAATYIIRRDGTVAYAFVDADYKKRAETKDIIKKLKSL